MKLAELIDRVHEDRVDWGDWDGETREARTACEICARWTRAYEEGKEGRPLIYRRRPPFSLDAIATPQMEEYKTLLSEPRGTAMEVAEGCLLILDWLGHAGYDAGEDEADILWTIPNRVPEEIEEAAAYLTKLTAYAYNGPFCLESILIPQIRQALQVGMTWLYMRGLDPLGTVLEKHEWRWQEEREKRWGT